MPKAVVNGAFNKPGKLIFFAIDNSDIKENTPDVTRNIHATATAIYQRKEASDAAFINKDYLVECFLLVESTRTSIVTSYLLV